MEKIRMVTEVAESGVDVHDTWVSAQIDTRTMTSESLADSHLTNSLQVSIFNQDDESVTLDLTRNVHVSLAGVWNESNYISEELADVRLTLDEVKLIRDALTAFVRGVENGSIQPR